MWIKKFVLGGAAVPGGLRRAVKRARGDKGHATFHGANEFRRPRRGLASGFIVDPRRDRGRAGGGGWLGPGLWFATSVAFSAFVFLLAALECGVRYYCFKSSCVGLMRGIGGV